MFIEVEREMRKGSKPVYGFLRYIVPDILRLCFSKKGSLSILLYHKKVKVYYSVTPVGNTNCCLVKEMGGAREMGF